ncbi:alpha/beta hydrolase fold domain-containing protein [Pseudomonas protegens]|uniref:Alpha/beta hydrolase fold domain-containing protein n=1 Tax=Pseudomonas protegens TaxID=380021 RepID=A0A7G8YLW9_9PSED|nr:alpha/beta hydrolase fold domain-containing protein [Pseudomonas protegens]QNH76669.1 alpha/beta hydrolase fold domain-containing protein [Pseudomonas protegens]QNL05863.1 alpha/beta hydrolase fold domain-containing protein [Pseudomonas protegens]
MPESTAPLNLCSSPCAPLEALIIGSGFGGLGTAIALRKAGVSQFLLLEKGQDVGGVWRDNTYPGAACDVPSHLYSFSFEPNPRWSRVFAPQAEIHDYLQHCARTYDLLPHIHFGSEVRHARFDETGHYWQVVCNDGQEHFTRLLISAVGQLSRPALPKLPGMHSFRGRVFHSAHWDHHYALADKRVAVIGTGASAIQFVPQIADQVAALKVFQRSPAYIMPKADRAYSEQEKQRLARQPWRMKLLRAAHYLHFESRALGFTRLKGLTRWVVGGPFNKLLHASVASPELRRQMTPDYPIGCKRILLSNDYLKTFDQAHVQLVTEGIRRITEHGIETLDGQQHTVDAIIYGTGFAATEFLSPMRISGRDGLDLNQAWQDGAAAYLGISVPGFPNFFMLYGPNTNLGHNSIIHMLESQISHVMQARQALLDSDASQLEVDEHRHQRFQRRIQRRLATSVWSGCKSWYVDERGHNSTNWPGFTWSYRWLARYAGLAAYRLSSPLDARSPDCAGQRIAAPRDWLERANAAFLRVFLRVSFKALIGPPRALASQRKIVDQLSWLMPGCLGVKRRSMRLDGLSLQIVEPASTTPKGVILYLHGGAFCLGGPRSHYSVSSRLARDSGCSVWVPDYRLAPEHPYPAALEDCLACYDAIRAQLCPADKLLIAGDSAGGALVLALALALKERGEEIAAGLMLLSPVTDPDLGGASMQSRQEADPMIRRDWLEQALKAYAAPAQAPTHRPLEADLRGLPPMLIQVGDQELLLSDSTRLAERARQSAVACQLEIHEGRWHVFQLQAFYLRSARNALLGLARFARQCLETAGQARQAADSPRTTQPATDAQPG